MKKVLATLLAASLAFGFVALPAAESGETLFGFGFTASAETGESGFEYTVLDDGTIEIMRYTGDEEDVVIPSTIEGKRVTSIGDSAFYGCSNLTDITIPNSVTRIGDSAFIYCDGLTSITIPNSVTSIGNSAFESCGKLTSIIIPDSVISIGDSAFSYCYELISIYIPKSVNIIGNNAFLSSRKLESITVDSGNKYYSSKDGVLFNKDQTTLLYLPASRTTYDIPETVKKIGNRAFRHCSDLTNVTIPNSVTSIGEYAFAYCYDLSSVTIPNSVTTIEKSAFYNSGIKSITIPNSITSIEDSLFEYCGGLTSITIPDSVTSIGASAFHDCTKLTSITIPESVTRIGEHAFSQCGFESITLPNSITRIENDLFYGCNNLTTVNIPDSVTSIGDDVFYFCDKLVNITIPSSVIDVSSSTFSNCYNLMNIYVDANNKNYSSKNGVLFNKDKTTLIYCPMAKTTFTIPNGVTSIGDGAFSRCNLTEIIIPSSVRSIGVAAFWYSRNLTSVTIPSGVTSIGDRAFTDCPKLSYIKVLPSNNYFSSEDGVLFNKDKTKLIQYPLGKESTSYTIPDGVEIIGNSAFRSCSTLKSITIPNSLIRIEAWAFATTFENFFFLDDVYYNGIQSEWNNISIDGSNPALESATIHYNPDDTHTHSYTSAITKQPTCTADGVKTFTCKCGDTYTESIPAIDHKSSSWITDKPAAIGVSGSKHKACIVCGKVLETATIPALPRISLTSAAVKLSNTVYAYDGAAKKPTVTLTLSGKTLKNGTDYSVTYSNNVKVGTATVKIVGKGDYTGTITKTFAIKNDFKKSVVSGIATKTYTGKALTQNLTVKFGTKTLKNGTDYTVTYSNNVKVGTATVKIVGKGNYTGTITKTFAIKNDFKKSVVSGIATKVYTGKALTQNLTVKFGTKALKNGTDYTVTYSNNVKVGTATVKITGKGSYTGTITKTFKINPAKQSISKLVAKSKGFVVNWLKKDNASGYQLQYTTDSKFKTASTVVITSKNTVSKTVAKLAAGKRYYVRVRTYTTINGVKYYGAWSAVKNVVTKK